MRKLVVSLVAVPVIASTVPVFAQESEFDVRARETEQQMTDDERFARSSVSQAPLASREAYGTSAIPRTHR
jgi:hypothetical protein